MPLAAMHRIGKLGALMQSVQCIMRKVALRAARFTANQAHRFQLRQQIIPAAIHMQHAIGKAPAAFLRCRHQPCVIRAMREIIGHANGIDSGCEQGFIRHTRHLAAIDENARLQRPERFPIISGSHQHGRASQTRLTHKI